MKLGHTSEIYLKYLSRTILQKSSLANNKEKPLRMFLLACSLLKRYTYSNNFLEIFVAKDPCGFKKNQIKPDSSQCKCSEPFSFLINQKFLKETYQNDQMLKMTTKDTRQYVATTSQGKSVSFRYHWKRLCDALNWSVLLRYQLLLRYGILNQPVLFTFQ